MKMNLHRAQELIEPLRKGTANGISEHWRARLIEALEYVIEHESQPTQSIEDVLITCAHCGNYHSVYIPCPLELARSGQRKVLCQKKM